MAFGNESNRTWWYCPFLDQRDLKHDREEHPRRHSPHHEHLRKIACRPYVMLLYMTSCLQFLAFSRPYGGPRRRALYQVRPTPFKKHRLLECFEEDRVACSLNSGSLKHGLSNGVQYFNKNDWSYDKGHWYFHRGSQPDWPYRTSRGSTFFHCSSQIITLTCLTAPLSFHHINMGRKPLHLRKSS